MHVRICHVHVIVMRWGDALVHVLSDHPNSETMKRVLKLPSTVVMEYKAHDASIRDNSSFRNTDVFS